MATTVAKVAARAVGRLPTNPHNYVAESIRLWPYHKAKVRDWATRFKVTHSEAVRMMIELAPASNSSKARRAAKKLAAEKAAIKEQAKAARPKKPPADRAALLKHKAALRRESRRRQREEESL